MSVLTQCGYIKLAEKTVETPAIKAPSSILLKSLFRPDPDTFMSYSNGNSEKYNVLFFLLQKHLQVLRKKMSAHLPFGNTDPHTEFTGALQTLLNSFMGIFFWGGEGFPLRVIRKSDSAIHQRINSYRE